MQSTVNDCGWKNPSNHLVSSIISLLSLTICRREEKKKLKVIYSRRVEILFFNPSFFYDVDVWDAWYSERNDGNLSAKKIKEGEEEEKKRHIHQQERPRVREKIIRRHHRRKTYQPTFLSGSSLISSQRNGNKQFMPPSMLASCSGGEEVTEGAERINCMADDRLLLRINEKGINWKRERERGKFRFLVLFFLSLSLSLSFAHFLPRLAWQQTMQ